MNAHARWASGFRQEQGRLTVGTRRLADHWEQRPEAGPCAGSLWKFPPVVSIFQRWAAGASAEGEERGAGGAQGRGDRGGTAMRAGSILATATCLITTAERQPSCGRGLWDHLQLVPGSLRRESTGPHQG